MSLQDSSLQDLFLLNNMQAIITGGAGSIGLRTAIAMAKQGAEVVLVDVREDALKTAVEQIHNETGKKASIFVCNLRNLDESQKLFNTVESQFGQVDIVVNNAGIDRDKLFMRMSEEDLGIVMDINFRAPFFISQSAAIAMSKRKFGRIINISSVVAFTGNPGQANYCSSKAALLGMSRSIALEYAKKGITVNCIAPGAIESPMTENLSDEAKQAFLSKIPVGHMGSPNEIAYTACFLASREASYITGQTFHVNGGMLMP